MAAKQAGESAISDAAIKAGTGKSWTQWLRILDRWNAADKGHKDTARHLHDHYGLSSWWSQMVTVRYEQERGLRTIGERAGGQFELSVQRTIATSPRKAFDAFTDAKQLSQWFTTKARVNLEVGGRYSNGDGDKGEFRVVKPPSKVRFTWENVGHCPGTIVEATFTKTGPNKTAVRIQHMKLPDKKGRDDMREGWTWALTSMKSYLETGKPLTFEEWKKSKKK